MSHLVQLRTFLETYRLGSITRAAANLGLSQPAASAHIHALEVTMEKSLFNRQARGVIPTAAAHDLAQIIGDHLDAIETGLTAAKARSTLISGRVTIAGPAEYLSERCGKKFADMIAAHGLQLRFLLGNRERIYAWLASGDADLAITASRPTDRALGFEETYRERLLLVAAPQFARSLAKRPASPDTLAASPLVAYDEDLPLIRTYFQEVFHAETRSRIAAVAPDLRLVRGLVEAGIGYSVLPDYLISDHLAQGKLIEIGKPGPENAFYLVWVKTALRHPRVAFVRDSLLAYRSA
jgi:DNA-binding transcriptional LysR family regulator